MPVRDNYYAIQHRIRAACLKVGRLATDVQLMVVTKGQTQDSILPLLDLGHRLFGENRVQDAMVKWTNLKRTFSDIDLHMIGPLQTNKLKDALTVFTGLQTVDRLGLADKLPLGLTMPLFVQVNIGREPQKSGVLEEDLSTLLQKLKAYNVQGLMCLPPAYSDPTPYFLHLKELAHKHDLSQLSMGMSHDLEEAIACGATIVRVGRSIFKNG